MNRKYSKRRPRRSAQPSALQPDGSRDSLFSKAESFIYVTSAIIVHENVQKKDGAPVHSYPLTNHRVPRIDRAAPNSSSHVDSKALLQRGEARVLIQEPTTIHSMNFRDSALARTQEHAGNVIVLRCIPHEAVEVNHDAIQ